MAAHQKALALIEEALQGYRDLLMSGLPPFGQEASRRQVEAALLLDEALTIGVNLSDSPEKQHVMETWGRANAEIERLEAQRATGPLVLRTTR